MSEELSIVHMCLAIKGNILKIRWNAYLKRRAVRDAYKACLRIAYELLDGTIEER